MLWFALFPVGFGRRYMTAQSVSSGSPTSNCMLISSLPQATRAPFIAVSGETVVSCPGCHCKAMASSSAYGGSPKSSRKSSGIKGFAFRWAMACLCRMCWVFTLVCWPSRGLSYTWIWSTSGCCRLVVEQHFGGARKRWMGCPLPPGMMHFQGSVSLHSVSSVPKTGHVIGNVTRTANWDKLVVSNMFFPYIGNNHPNCLSYFSEG